jgi:cell division protein FtsB
MKKMKDMWLRFCHIRGLKYGVVVVIAIVLIGFVDENSAWRHFRNKQRLQFLQEEIDRYTEQNKYNQAQIRMLDSNPKAIEKIARERYFMKNDGEDIFVLSDDGENPIRYTDDDETAE